MVIDSTNINIIRCLCKSPMSFREIGNALSVTENTVRSRVKKLKKEGILHVTGLVDPAKLPNHSVAFVGVKFLSMNLLEKSREISALKGVVSVIITTGRYDLILIVMLNDTLGLLDFFNKEMSKISDVLSTETFIAFNHTNLTVPYVL